MTIYRYTGQRIETGTGLYDYGARWYDPAIGRFLAADSIVPNPGDSQALNRYMYVLGNPLRYIDPTGHTTICGEACEAAYPWSPPRPGSGSPRPTPQPQPAPTPPRPAPTGTPGPGSIVMPTQSAGSAAVSNSGSHDFSYLFADLMWFQYSHLLPWARKGTLGMGVGGNVAVGVGGAITVGGYWDWDGNIALFAVDASVLASTGVLTDAEFWIQSTTASSISELFSGTDVFFGFDAALGPGLGGDIVFGGPGSDGYQVVGLEASVNLGAAVSPEFVAPVEFHGGASTVIMRPILTVNFYDILGVTRPSLR